MRSDEMSNNRSFMGLNMLFKHDFEQRQRRII